MLVFAFAAGDTVDTRFVIVLVLAPVLLPLLLFLGLFSLNMAYNNYVVLVNIIMVQIISKKKNAKLKHRKAPQTYSVSFLFEFHSWIMTKPMDFFSRCTLAYSSNINQDYSYAHRFGLYCFFNAVPFCIFRQTQNVRILLEWIKRKAHFVSMASAHILYFKSFYKCRKYFPFCVVSRPLFVQAHGI